MNNWISVKDRLPLEQDHQSTYRCVKVIVSDGVDVDCELFCSGGNHTGKTRRGFSDYGEIDANSIIEWQYMPEPTSND